MFHITVISITFYLKGFLQLKFFDSPTQTVPSFVNISALLQVFIILDFFRDMLFTIPDYKCFRVFL